VPPVVIETATGASELRTVPARSPESRVRVPGIIFEGQLWIRMLVPCRDGSTQLFEVQFDAGEAKDLAAAVEKAVAEAER
jgi:hypothetical protein